MRTWKSKEGIPLSEIVRETGGEIDGDGSILIGSAAPIQSAVAGQISFVANIHYAKHLATTKASALVLDLETERPPQCPAVIRHKNPYLIFSRAVRALHEEVPHVQPGAHPLAVIEPGADVHESAGVGPFCHVRTGARIGPGCQLVSGVYVGRDVTLGANCLLYPGAKVLDGAKVGDNVIIHASSVIGSDGFGFAESETGHEKVLQLGWVEIENDVEIGSNSSVDRGTIGPTRIGRGTKIDNLVQIAHNVEIGDNCIIVAQVGISGSTRLGKGVVLAGQVGVVGHIVLGDHVRVAAQSGVSRSVEAGKMVFGSPARDYMETQRIEVALRKLPQLLKTVKQIEKKLLDTPDK